MKRRTALATAALPVILWGCASKPKRPNVAFRRINTSAYARTLSTPEAGVVKRANVGDVIISTHRVAVVPSWRLALSTKVAVPYSDKWKLIVDLRQGEYPLVATDDAGGRYFSAFDPLQTTYKSVEQGTRPEEGPAIPGGIHVDADGTTSVFLMDEDSDAVLHIVPKEFEHLLPSTAEVSLPDDPLQKDLLFVGAVGNIVTLRYRAYALSTAQKEFTLDVRYDLTQGRSVGYQEGRFDIIEANNLGITYKVLMPLK